MAMIASGVFFYSSSSRRYLYLLRADTKHTTWSIPGGKLEPEETLLQGIERECTEEIGMFNTDWKLIPIQKFVNKSFTYNTFFCEVKEEFVPILNEEHIGYAWVQSGNYPKPLHPGLFSTINIDIVIEKLNLLT